MRRCEFTNYCEGLDQHHKQVTCKLWDRVAVDEPGVPLATRRQAPAVAPLVATSRLIAEHARP